MSQPLSTCVLIGLASCISIISFIAYSRFSSEKKGFGTEKADDRAIETKKISNADEPAVDEAVSNAGRPMFDCDNNLLAITISDMAERRAKQWISFRITDAHCMVGQVGGKSHHKRPILILESFVMKPVRLDHRGIREIAFYEAIQAASNRKGFDTYCSLFGPRVRDEKRNELQPLYDLAKAEIETKLLHQLEQFTPKYFGTVQYQKNPVGDEKATAATSIGSFGIRSNSYIVLTDATKNFSKPCILDIKFGTKTFEPDAPEEKKKYELNKYKQQHEFGFRLTAMRMYDPSNEKANELGYINYPKKIGRSLTTRESVKQALLVFLGGAELSGDVRVIRSAAIQRILSRLKLIKRWFRDNTSFAFYGSSILIIYEGDTEQKEVDGEELDIAIAKIIDFGRVRRQSGGDRGYYKGLSTLITLLEEILKESFLKNQNT